MNFSNHMISIQQKYPDAPILLAKFMQPVLDICRQKLGDEYSDDELHQSIEEYFIRKYCDVYLEVMGVTDTPMTDENNRRLSTMLRSVFPHDIQELSQQSPETLQWLLFGDESYSDFRMLHWYLHIMANAVQNGQTQCKNQQFYDDIMDNIQSSYETMTDYGRKMANWLISDIQGYLWRICPSAKESPYMLNLVAASEDEAI